MVDYSNIWVMKSHINKNGLLDLAEEVKENWPAIGALLKHLEVQIFLIFFWDTFLVLKEAWRKCL